VGAIDRSRANEVIRLPGQQGVARHAEKVNLTGWKISLGLAFVAAAALPVQATLQPAVYADSHDVSGAPRVPLVDVFGGRALLLSLVPLVVAGVVAMLLSMPSASSARAGLAVAGVLVLVALGLFVTIIVGFWIMPTAWLLVLASGLRLTGMTAVPTGLHERAHTGA
jgi:hypothetical protein